METATKKQEVVLNDVLDAEIRQEEIKEAICNLKAASAPASGAGHYT